MKRLLIAAVLFALAASAGAQFIGRSVLVSQLGSCNGTRQVGYVTDATSATVLGTGGGSAKVWVDCTSGSWALSAVAAVADLSAYLPVSGTTAAPIVIQNSGAGNDGSFIVIDDMIFSGTDWLPTFSATADLVAPVFGITATTSFTVTSPVQLQTASTSATVTSPVQVNTASTSILDTTPIHGISGVYERKVTNVTGADDGAGTKPAVAIPITTDFATCTCNDATGCTATIAEPTPTSGYGRSLTVVSIGTGNCEFADSSGVQEIGTTVVLEPTSVMTFAYLNSSWYNTSYKDNVP